MSVASLQETKWFGDEMYEVEYSVVATGADSSVLVPERQMIGPHGYGELNEAGQELLSFLSVNGAMICYT